MISKKAIIFAFFLATTQVFAEEKANDLVESRPQQVVSAPELTELLSRDDSIAPSTKEHDVKIEEYKRQTQIIQALAERNSALRQLEELYGLDEWLTGNGSTQGSDGSPRSMGRNGDSDGLSGFMGVNTGLRGSDASMNGNKQETENARTKRFAALQSFLSFGSERTAVVRWDPITPTVKSGDILPGGFSIIEIRKNDIVMEKDGVVFSLTQEPVSIDALLEVIAQRRETE